MVEDEFIDPSGLSYFERLGCFTAGIAAKVAPQALLLCTDECGISES